MVMMQKGDKYVTVRNGQKNSTKNFKSNLPKDANGKILASTGRPKGVPNRVSSEAKVAIALAYEGIGGLPALIKWGKENQTAFYTQVYTKIIALQVQGKIDMDVNFHGEEARRNLETAFSRIIDERQKGSEEPAVYVDGERMRDVTPQLVLSRKSGTDTS